MTTKDLLIAARARIADEAHWTTKTVARNASGEPVRSCDPSATSWCTWGAIVASAVGGGFHALVMHDAETALLQQLRGVGDELGDYNDRVTHRSVIKLFDRAIAAQPEAGAER